MASALQAGLYSRFDVADWVAEEIARRDVLPETLVELTALRRRSDEDIASLLRLLGPAQTNVAQSRTDMAVLYHLVQAGRLSAPEAAHRVAFVGYWLPENECADLLSLEYAIDHGAPHAARAFMEALERYADFTDE